MPGTVQTSIADYGTEIHWINGFKVDIINKFTDILRIVNKGIEIYWKIRYYHIVFGRDETAGLAIWGFIFFSFYRFQDITDIIIIIIPVILD